MGLLQRNGTESFGLSWFYRRRLSLIYPLRWAAHQMILGVGAVSSILAFGIDWRFPLSFIGIRVYTRLILLLNVSFV